MRISYEWLKTMVDVPEDPSKLVDEFVRTGTEVEAVERVGADLDYVVTAQVVSKKPHPDSDHMFVCLVDVGEKNLGADGKPEPLQIVCGAQNFNEGDHIVTAMIGAVLPGDVKIKKSKLRGVVSMGMNCSERELGLGNDHDGIMILPPDAPVGMDFTDYRGMSDTVIDCEITPNRPDCLSMCGMAVEVAAMLDEDTHIELPRVQSECGPDAHDLVDVAIDDPELCQRYTARVVRNVKIGPSPEWLARRVIAAGSRPVNNVVDVTNYVMYLTGQPLHAFDLGKLTERDGKRHIVVRAAADGEQLETLDGVERTLTPDMAVITDDGKTPVALAGVMGGMNSEIDENTVDVLLVRPRLPHESQPRPHERGFHPLRAPGRRRQLCERRRDRRRPVRAVLRRRGLSGHRGRLPHGCPRPRHRLPPRSRPHALWRRRARRLHGPAPFSPGLQGRARGRRSPHGDRADQPPRPHP